MQKSGETNWELSEEEIGEDSLFIGGITVWEDDSDGWEAFTEHEIVGRYWET